MNYIPNTKAISEMTVADRAAEVTKIQASIDEIIAEKNRLQEMHNILNRLENMYLYDYD